MSFTLLGITLTMVIGYSWLMEANLVSGVLFSSEIRLHRTADAWIASRSESASLADTEMQAGERASRMPPADGTPIVYSHRAALPDVVQQHLSDTLVDGQFTIVEIDKVGLLNIGYLLHLFRLSPNGEELHVVQQLVLARYEEARVQEFDALMYERSLKPAAFFFLATIAIVLLFGRYVAKATSRLLEWCDSLSIESLPDRPPILPFTEMRRIAAGTLATVQRERDAIEHRHRFLRFASHELRTPLAIAAANTELLARYGVDDNATDALARLQASLDNMTGLTNTLLWLGRGETPLPEPEPVDLHRLVSEIVEAQQAQADSNRLVIRVSEASHQAVVQPRVLLVILCTNLISNAIRYTRDGCVDVRLSEAVIEIENRGKLLGNEAGAGGHGLGLQLVEWVVERADWHWHEEGDDAFRCHRIRFAPANHKESS